MVNFFCDFFLINRQTALRTANQLTAQNLIQIQFNSILLKCWKQMHIYL